MADAGELSKTSKTFDPRIRNALLSIHPTSDHAAWHAAPSALGLLRGVDAATAVWRPYPEANNLREIALHVAFWENRIADRLTGDVVHLTFERREGGWPIRRNSIDESSWREDVRMARACHRRLIRAVDAFDPSRLDEPLGERSTRPAIEYIHGVAEHSLYHAAQIKMLKQLARRRGTGTG